METAALGEKDGWAGVRGRKIRENKDTLDQIISMAAIAVKDLEEGVGDEEKDWVSRQMHSRSVSMSRLAW